MSVTISKLKNNYIASLKNITKYKNDVTHIRLTIKELNKQYCLISVLKNDYDSLMQKRNDIMKQITQYKKQLNQLRYSGRELCEKHRYNKWKLKEKMDNKSKKYNKL